jgi:hypothetical protein
MSVVGGLFVFGPAGLILGPVTLMVTTVLLEIWRSRAAPEACSRFEKVSGPEDVDAHIMSRNNSKSRDEPVGAKGVPT